MAYCYMNANVVTLTCQWQITGRIIFNLKQKKNYSNVTYRILYISIVSENVKRHITKIFSM